MVAEFWISIVVGGRASFHTCFSIVLLKPIVVTRSLAQAGSVITKIQRISAVSLTKSSRWVSILIGWAIMRITTHSCLPVTIFPISGAVAQQLACPLELPCIIDFLLQRSTVAHTHTEMPCKISKSSPRWAIIYTGASGVVTKQISATQCHRAFIFTYIILGTITKGEFVFIVASWASRQTYSGRGVSISGR